MAFLLNIQIRRSLFSVFATAKKKKIEKFRRRVEKLVIGVVIIIGTDSVFIAILGSKIKFFYISRNFFLQMNVK